MIFVGRGEAITVARRLGIGVPSSPTPSEEWELQAVAGMSGDAFDAAVAEVTASVHRLLDALPARRQPPATVPPLRRRRNI